MQPPLSDSVHMGNPSAGQLRGGQSAEGHTDTCLVTTRCPVESDAYPRGPSGPRCGCALNTSSSSHADVGALPPRKQRCPDHRSRRLEFCEAFQTTRPVAATFCGPPAAFSYSPKCIDAHGGEERQCLPSPKLVQFVSPMTRNYFGV